MHLKYTSLVLMHMMEEFAIELIIAADLSDVTMETTASSTKDETSRQRIKNIEK